MDAFIFGVTCSTTEQMSWCSHTPATLSNSAKLYALRAALLVFWVPWSTVGGSSTGNGFSGWISGHIECRRVVPGMDTGAGLRITIQTLPDVYGLPVWRIALYKSSIWWKCAKIMNCFVQREGHRQVLCLKYISGNEIQSIDGSWSPTKSQHRPSLALSASPPFPLRPFLSLQCSHADWQPWYFLGSVEKGAEEQLFRYQALVGEMDKDSACVSLSRPREDCRVLPLHGSFPTILLRLWQQLSKVTCCQGCQGPTLHLPVPTAWHVCLSASRGSTLSWRGDTHPATPASVPLVGSVPFCGWGRAQHGVQAVEELPVWGLNAEQAHCCLTGSLCSLVPGHSISAQGFLGTPEAVSRSCPTAEHGPKERGDKKWPDCKEFVWNLCAVNMSCGKTTLNAFVRHSHQYLSHWKRTSLLSGEIK